MQKVVVNCKWLPDNFELNIEYPLKVVVWIDRLPNTEIPEGEMRIFVVWEPNIKNVMIAKIRQPLYDYLFTYHEELLNIKKSVFFLGATVFVRDPISGDKEFGVSTVVGSKKGGGFKGYAMRHELWFRQDEIVIPKSFYITGSHLYESSVINTDYGNLNIGYALRIGERKEPIFKEMFHIAIENCFLKHWYTEKIIDCFRSHVVPIYVGASAISEEFNKDGIISVSSVDEIISVCNNLTEDDYFSRMDAMNDNFNISERYMSFNNMLEDKILEVLP